jgi:hypothetical protein
MKVLKTLSGVSLHAASPDVPLDLNDALDKLAPEVGHPVMPLQLPCNCLRQRCKQTFDLITS